MSSKPTLASGSLGNKGALWGLLGHWHHAQPLAKEVWDLQEAAGVVHLWAPPREDHLRLTLKAQECMRTHTNTNTHPCQRTILTISPLVKNNYNGKFQTFALLLRPKDWKSVSGKKHITRIQQSRKRIKPTKPIFPLPSLLLPQEWKGKREELSGNINIRCHRQSSDFLFSCLPVWLLLCTISTLGPMQTMPQTSHFSLPFGSRIPPSLDSSWIFLLSAISLLSVRGSSRLLPSSWALISSSWLRGFLSHSSSLCISSFTEFAEIKKKIKKILNVYFLSSQTPTPW